MQDFWKIQKLITGGRHIDDPVFGDVFGPGGLKHIKTIDWDHFPKWAMKKELLISHSQLWRIS